MKGEIFHLKKNLNEDIQFLKLMNQKQDSIAFSLNQSLNANLRIMRPSSQKLVNLENITSLIKVAFLIFFFNLYNKLKKKEELEEKKTQLNKKQKAIEKFKQLDESLKLKKEKFLQEMQIKYEKKMLNF